MSLNEHEGLLKTLTIGIFAIIILYFMNPEVVSWFWVTFIRVIIAVFFTWTIVSFIVNEEVSLGSIVVAIIGFIVYMIYSYYTDTIWDITIMLTYILEALVMVCVFKILTKELKGRIESNF